MKDTMHVRAEIFTQQFNQYLLDREVHLVKDHNLSKEKYMAMTMGLTNELLRLKDEVGCDFLPLCVSMVVFCAMVSSTELIEKSCNSQN